MHTIERFFEASHIYFSINMIVMDDYMFTFTKHFFKNDQDALS